MAIPMIPGIKSMTVGWGFLVVSLRNTTAFSDTRCSSRRSSLYRMVILTLCSPYFGSPSKSRGMLNGTGESVSSSSMN